MSLVKSNSYGVANPTKVKVGNSLATTAVGGGLLYITAGVLPFITFPMLIIAAVIGAIYFKFSA